MDSEQSIWRHEPVMVNRVLELLRLERGMQVLEGCLGLGGHTIKFLEKIADRGQIWGFELDPRVAEEAQRRLHDFKGRFTIFIDDYRNFDLHLSREGIEQIDAAFFDFGVGFFHFGETHGMALKKELPIDFRLSPTMDIPTGAELVEGTSEDQLARLMAEAGERRFARRVAKAIIATRPIRTTANLARIIESAVPRKYHKPGVSPAQRIFAHLRVTVNDERGAIIEMTSKLVKWLRTGGRVVFLCYTSGELSMVRKYLKGTGCTCPPNAPVCVCPRKYSYRVLADGERPTAQEVSTNPSARSARLAAGELLIRPEEGLEE